MACGIIGGSSVFAAWLEEAFENACVQYYVKSLNPPMLPGQNIDFCPVYYDLT